MKQTHSPQNSGSLRKASPVPATETNQLKEQFLADLELAGLASKSRGTYLAAVERLIRFYWCSPAELTEQQVSRYLLENHRSNPPKGTFKVMRFSLRFLFNETLGRDWHLFKKK